MVTKLNPLTWNRPISDDKGRPTKEFQIKWQQLYDLASTIPSLSTPAAVSAVLDILAGDPGDMLVRGASEWEGLASPNDGTLFLSGTNPPSWDTPPSGTLVTTGNAGIVPALSGDGAEYFDGNGNYTVPPVGPTYGIVTAFLAGLVPPLSADPNEYFDGNGNWTVPPGTTYGVVTTSADGLAPTLSGNSNEYLDGDGNYTVPPGTGPTYGLATTSAIGLAPILSGNATDYLDGDGNYNPVPVVTTSNDGLAPTLSGAATEYLDGDGNWSVPAGSTPGAGPLGQYIVGAFDPYAAASSTAFATKGTTFEAFEDITIYGVIVHIQNNQVQTYKPIAAILSNYTNGSTISSLEDGPAVTTVATGYNQLVLLPLDAGFDVDAGDAFMVGATCTSVAAAANPFIMGPGNILNPPGPWRQRYAARLASIAPAVSNAIDTNGNSWNNHPVGIAFSYR